MNTKSERRKRGIMLLLLTAGVICILLGTGVLVSYLWETGARKGLGVVEGDVLVEIPVGELPENALYISGERREYDGTMRLVIPKLGVDTPVGATTEPEELKQVPGLYEFAQMPDEPQGNVSIAGHRDIYNEVFYHLDKLGEGDSILLIYEDLVYRYGFRESKTVGPDNWDVIRRQDFTAVTLTTCDPIGTAKNRLVVTGELVEVTASWEEADDGE